MNKKPNAILHMTGYGLVYGFLLAMLYVWGIIIFASSGGSVDFASLIFSGFFAFLLGALPGTVLGFLEGWLIWWVTRKIHTPLSETKFASNTNQLMFVAGIATFLIMTGILYLFVANPFMDYNLIMWFILVPALMASGAAAYAARRYMLKLRAWGESFEKSKNDAHYKTKKNLSYDNRGKIEPSYVADDDNEEEQFEMN